jgi:hypothetical protein
MVLLLSGAVARRNTVHFSQITFKQQRGMYHVQAPLFPKSTGLLQLVTSIGRNAVLVDQQLADLFGCGGFNTSTPSRTGR